MNISRMALLAVAAGLMIAPAQAQVFTETTTIVPTVSTQLLQSNVCTPTTTTHLIEQPVMVETAPRLIPQCVSQPVLLESNACENACDTRVIEAPVMLENSCDSTRVIENPVLIQRGNLLPVGTEVEFDDDGRVTEIDFD